MCGMWDVGTKRSRGVGCASWCVAGACPLGPPTQRHFNGISSLTQHADQSIRSTLRYVFFCVRKENEMTTCVRASKVEGGRRAEMRVTMMHLITKDGRSRPYSRPSRHSKCPCNNTQILKIISGNLFRIRIIENATSPHDIRSRPKTRAHICTM